MTGLIKFYQMLAIIFVLSASSAFAQDDGFIYGRVTTIDDDVYEGALRWGKEEAYWTDMFNASKEENRNIDYLSNEELDYLRETRYDNWASRSNTWVNMSWDWNDNEFIHQFSCQFGEIKSLVPRSRDRVDVEMQNGNIIEVDGDGYNDIGAKVRVMDEELGTIELSWSRIEMVEFLPTPKDLEDKFGEPLYGTVETDIGEFTGFVQWDHDERVSEDKLDGDTYDGDLSIEFGKIKSIERIGYSRSEVTLHSGRKLELRGSNDVNSENRGIIVTIEGLGRIDVPWRDFDKVTFTDAPNSGKNYNAFKDQSELTGTVLVTNGDKHEGKIIFDLDEEYDYEVLNGRDDEIEFIIPFRNIASIIPESYESSTVKLRNGEEYRLSESQDVSEDHTGIVVLKGREPVYIPWNKVEELKLR